MGWVRIDDQFARHPKVLRAGPLASWLHVCALTYSAQYLTDGFIPSSAVAGLADFSDLEGMDYRDLPGDLVKVGLWLKVDGGYQIHDYLEFNPSRDDVLKKRRADADRKNPERFHAESGRNPNGVATDSSPPVPRPRPRKPLVSQEELQRTRKTEVDQTFKDDLEEQFWQAFGSREALRDCIDTAMSHKARLKCTDQQAYLRNWVRADAERRGHPRQNGRPRPLAIVEHPREPDELEQPPPPRGKQPCADCGDVTLLALTGPYCYPCTSRRRKKTPA